MNARNRGNPLMGLQSRCCLTVVVSTIVVLWVWLSDGKGPGDWKWGWSSHSNGDDHGDEKENSELQRKISKIIFNSELKILIS